MEFKWADRYTDRQTDTLTAILHTSIEGKVIKNIILINEYYIMHIALYRLCVASIHH